MACPLLTYLHQPDEPEPSECEPAQCRSAQVRRVIIHKRVWSTRTFLILWMLRHLGMQHWDEVYGPKYEMSTKTKYMHLTSLSILRTDPPASKTWLSTDSGSRTDVHWYDRGQFAVHNTPKPGTRCDVQGPAEQQPSVPQVDAHTPVKDEHGAL
ncbi:uncharacterized protein B0H18DRAFT_950813 [Fomitopsis serialis]|uniref:uncharacterized protein n=1 Tax=Fomitopsis serialis TaxID=139415 RepID=UPI002007F7AD|nr:uncharacterized protein B0H18DRAFT_950813 [Neoantrodia serialis]KAH9936580.1 hypothetical protein B0H18DRAFT_950813 [Neoantrodia serialis]